MTAANLYIPRRKLLERPERFTLDRTHPLSNGLVAAYLGGMGYGTTYYHDSSLFGSPGTLTGFATPASSWSRALGRAFLGFDGTDDNVNFGSILSFEYTDAFSVSLWTKETAATVSGLKTLVGKNNAGVAPYNGWQLGISGDITGDPYICYLINNGAYLIHVGCARPSDLAWHHLCMTYSGSGLGSGVSFYLDGVRQTASVITDNLQAHSIITTSPFLLGAYDVTSGKGNYAGCQADVLVVQGLLRTSAIASLADPSNVMLSGLILPPRRVSFASAGGAPAGFKAAWAIRQCRVIGGGTI